MNNTQKSQECNVLIGTVISGKWHKNVYKIIKSLGSGATGVVYLAHSSRGLVALKISENSMSITSEVNVLKHFSKVQGSALGPSLLDVDDWVKPGTSHPVPFYVMEYVNGEGFITFIEKRGQEWIGILSLQLLADLERLHQAGWVFGDLKPDNLLVIGPPPKVRWLDVGGTTVQGRAIKEFTEFYDRGYWGLGSRKAEPSYDLFAVAMIMINACYPKRFSKSSNGRNQLKQTIARSKYLQKYERVLLNALDGKYQKAVDMRGDLVSAMSYTNEKPLQQQQNSRNVQHKNRSNIVKSRTKQKAQPKKKSKGGVLETVLIFLFVILAYTLYVYGQIL